MRGCVFISGTGDGSPLLVIRRHFTTLNRENPDPNQLLIFNHSPKAIVVSAENC